MEFIIGQTRTESVVAASVGDGRFFGGAGGERRSSSSRGGQGEEKGAGAGAAG